jgi:hypothetical protein
VCGRLGVGVAVGVGVELGRGVGVVAGVDVHAASARTMSAAVSVRILMRQMLFRRTWAAKCQRSSCGQIERGGPLSSGILHSNHYL